jgi:hypothetical protein
MHEFGRFPNRTNPHACTNIAIVLRQCRTAQRMIRLITDGEPHDIDVFHSEILVQDAGRAIYTTGAHE